MLSHVESLIRDEAERFIADKALNVGEHIVYDSPDDGPQDLLLAGEGFIEGGLAYSDILSEFIRGDPDKAPLEK